VPITITATPGSATANSFVTAAEMTAYCDARLNASIWTAADAQLPALVEATRDLSLLDYEAERTDDVQALSWPRQYAINPDAPTGSADPTIPVLIDGLPVYFADDEIPQRVKDATCELALQYLKLGTTDAAALPSSDGVIRERVDVLETEWADPAKRAVGLARWPRVIAFIAPLLATQGGGLDIVRT
jgi:hypothetical protein